MSLFQKRKPKKNWIQRNFWKIFWGVISIISIILITTESFEVKYQNNINSTVSGYIKEALNEYEYKDDLQKTRSTTLGFSNYITVEISGSIPQIAQYLEDENLIVSASSFVKYTKREGYDRKIQAGKNKLSPDMTIPQIVKKLLIAYKDPITVRIPEGYTLQEVDEYLFQKKFLKKNEFLECVEKTCDFSHFSFLPKERNKWEGYFFPATYEIDSDEFSVQKLGEEMLTGFQINAKSVGGFEDEKRTLNELVIMASMIEKESSTYAGKESNMISDVLWKRIDEGIPLGVDATIRYFLGIKSNALTVRDLRKDNPFNTRRNKGLPPHAISNFSAHSLQSAINPEKNQFYYYLHFKGIIHYGRTNAEHEQNKQKYCGGSCE